MTTTAHTPAPTAARVVGFYVGRTADDVHVWADLRLASLEALDRTTVDHTPAPADVPVLEFAASGCTTRGARRTAESFGQCLDALDDVVTVGAGNGWTADDVASFVAIWRRWHLNGMRAGCVHQRSMYGKGGSPDATCPDGYAFGSAWLVEPIPADVETEIRRLIAAAVTTRVAPR